MEWFFAGGGFNVVDDGELFWFYSNAIVFWELKRRGHVMHRDIGCPWREKKITQKQNLLINQALNC
jgi:hypothetical protein